MTAEIEEPQPVESGTQAPRSESAGQPVHPASSSVNESGGFWLAFNRLFHREIRKEETFKMEPKIPVTEEAALTPSRIMRRRLPELSKALHPPT